MTAVWILLGASFGLSALVGVLALIHADPPEDCPPAKAPERLLDTVV